MLLAIDVGNTNTVFAVISENEIMHSWRCATENTRSGDQYAVFLNQLFDLHNLKWSDISDVIVSSVVPDTNFHISKFCQNYIKCEAIFVSPKNADISIDLDQPQEIGADRLVNAAAIINNYPRPAIVIDFGTATTFDVIDADNVYRGGVIAPGIRLSMEALTSRAARLPNINIAKPDKAIGKNTQNAMQSGIYWGYIGLIEKIISLIQSELSGDVKVIATGGLAPLYACNTQVIDETDENLIFKGLLEIYKKIRD